MSRSITSKFLLVLALLLPSVSWGAVAFVQSCDTGTDGTTSTTTTCAFPGNTTAGNAIAGFYSVNEGGVDPPVVSGCGNTYSTPQTVTANGDTSIWFYAQNITGGACTVTITHNFVQPYRTLIIHEVSGVLTSGILDTSASQSVAAGTGSNAATSGAATTAAAGDYIFGAVHIADTLAMTITPGTGFTGRTVGAGDATHPPHRSEDQIQSSAGSIAATFTLSSANNAHVGMLALKASGGGGGGGSTARTLTLMGVGQ